MGARLPIGIDVTTTGTDRPPYPEPEVSRGRHGHTRYQYPSSTPFRRYSRQFRAHASRSPVSDRRSVNAAGDTVALYVVAAIHGHNRSTLRRDRAENDRDG